MRETYQGICTYCGQIQTVAAESQREADVIATKKCDCPAGEFENRKERLEETARLFSEEYGEEVAGEVFKLSLLALRGILQQATLNVEGVAFKVTLNSKGQVKIQKKETKQAEVQC